MTLRTIDDWWREYRKVIPRGAGTTQVIETRRAFYAGASAVLEALATVSGPDVTEAEGMKHLSVMHEEVDHFLARLKAGQA